MIFQPDPDADGSRTLRTGDDQDLKMVEGFLSRLSDEDQVLERPTPR